MNKKRKVEILAPAGSIEAMHAAINGGCNAVFLGGKKFGARAFADNFSNEQLKEAIQFAHLHGVKVYVTVNTLFYDEEIKEVMDYIDILYRLQVDALLIQDLGLINLVHQTFPDFEIHASTQASIHNLSGVEALKDMGVKRVVLSRESTIEDIKYICENTDLEIEVFVHGALCMSYSGQCLMSSLIGGRSGNRGTCAQPCRKPYSLYKDGEVLSSETYLLSTKDICTIDYLDQLIEAGVASFKIEGRMKKPEYVYTAVKMYREAVNSYYKNHTISYDKTLKDNLDGLFQRGYSKGYAFHEKAINQSAFPGHLGRLIGKVVDSTRYRVKIALTDTLRQNDGIRFGKSDEGRIVNKMFINNHLVGEGVAGNEVEIEFNKPIRKNTPVYLTTDSTLIKEIDTVMNKPVQNVPVAMKIKGKMGEPLTLLMSDGINRVKSVSEELISEPISQPVSQERIQAQLAKLGSTCYDLKKLEFDVPENMYISMKTLNLLRQNCCAKIDRLRIRPFHPATKQKVEIDLRRKKKGINRYYIYVETIEQLNAALNYSVDLIIYPYSDTILEAIEICAEEEVPFVMAVGRIHTDTQLQEIFESEAYSNVDTLLVGDLASYYYFGDKEVILDYSFNITNSYSLNSFDGEAVLSLELTENQINHLKTDREIGCYLYGRNEMMISEYCPISNHYFKEKREKCNLCKTGKFELEDYKNAKYPIHMDDHCRMHLLSHLTLKYTYFSELNVDFGILHFTTENEAEVVHILNDYMNILEGIEMKEPLVKTKYTLGYFKK